MGHLNAWRDKRKNRLNLPHTKFGLWTGPDTLHDKPTDRRICEKEIYPICLSVELSHFVVHSLHKFWKRWKQFCDASDVNGKTWRGYSSHATFRLRIFLNCWNMVPFTLSFHIFFFCSFLLPQSIYYILFSKLGRPSELFTLLLFIDCIYAWSPINPISAALHLAAIIVRVRTHNASILVTNRHTHTHSMLGDRE